MFWRQVSYFFGNIPVLILCLIGGIIWLVRVWKERAVRFTYSSLQILVVFVFSIAMLVALLMVMIARHPPVYEIPDHSLWYYTLSIQVIFLFGISIWLSRVEQSLPLQWKPGLYVGVLILITLNAWHYAEQRQIMIHSSQWFGYQYEQSRMLIEQFAASPPQHGPLSPGSNFCYLDERTRFLQTVQLLYDERTGGKAR